MNGVFHIRLHHAILAMVTLALLSLPFAHRVGAAPVTPEISQYIALGGALSDICGEGDLHAAGGCESCRIVAAMMLPLAPYVHAADLDTTSIIWPTRPATAVRLATPYTSPPVRAPPAV